MIKDIRVKNIPINERKVLIMAKVFSYDFERMLELLKIEQACVKRASGLDGNNEPCNRDCANCPLVQKTEDLLEMYEKAIRLVSREAERIKREKGYKQEAKARAAYWKNLKENDPEEYWRQLQEEAAGGEGW